MIVTRLDFSFTGALSERPHASFEEAERHEDYILILAACLYAARQPLLQFQDAAGEVWVEQADIPRLPPDVQRLPWKRKRGTTRARVPLGAFIELMQTWGVVQTVDIPDAPAKAPPRLHIV